jgi:hypothetical protein
MAFANASTKLVTLNAGTVASYDGIGIFPSDWRINDAGRPVITVRTGPSTGAPGSLTTYTDILILNASVPGDAAPVTFAVYTGQSRPIAGGAFEYRMFVNGSLSWLAFDGGVTTPVATRTSINTLRISDTTGRVTNFTPNVVAAPADAFVIVNENPNTAGFIVIDDIGLRSIMLADTIEVFNLTESDPTKVGDWSRADNAGALRTGQTILFRTTGTGNNERVTAIFIITAAP